jgi:hypothetical protein
MRPLRASTTECFHERHTDAADHAADALAAGRLRVDDATRAVGADEAPHPHLTEIRIDRDFGQHSAERMHGESRALVARLDVRRGFDRLAEATHGFREVVGACLCERILARLAAGRLHGATDARHRHRAAVHGRPRQPGVAKDARPSRARDRKN